MIKILLTCVVIFAFSLSEIYPQNISVDQFIFNGDYSSAIAELNAQLKNDSTNLTALKKLAQCYAALEQFENAAAVLTKASVIQEDDKELFRLMADVYYSSDQHEDAKKFYMQYLSADSSNLPVMLKLAKTFIALKEWENAKAVIKNLISMGDSISAYYELLGVCNEALAEYDDALVNLNIANRLNPKNLKVVLRLSNLYFKTERPVSAFRIAEKTLQYYPGVKDLWRIAAEAQFRLENFPEAANAYKQAIYLGDTSAAAYRNFGICLFNGNKLDSAVSYLDTAFKKTNEKDIVTALYLGVAYKDKNDFQNSVDYLKAVEAIQMNEYVTESYIQLGNVYQSQKNFEQAINWYKKALQLEPGRKAVLFNIAAAYDEAYADKSMAMKIFQQYIGDSTNTDKYMLDYAIDRVREITEEMHFNKPQ